MQAALAQDMRLLDQAVDIEAKGQLGAFAGMAASEHRAGRFDDGQGAGQQFVEGFLDHPFATVGYGGDGQY